MPHGSSKKFTAFRIDPELLQAVQAAAGAQGTNVTVAVEEGLRLWLARAKRKTKGDPPSKSHRRQQRAIVRHIEATMGGFLGEGRAGTPLTSEAA
jgi:hypothetical protein